MRPISELTFEHGKVLLRFRGPKPDYGIGGLCSDGFVRFRGEDHAWSVTSFTHFLPISEIAQLQEAGK